ncbi:MAG: ATP-binding protein [Beijerinckiaceae bacterium]
MKMPNAMRPLAATIAQRLGLAFGIVAAITVLAALVGWISFARIASTQSDITNVHLPSSLAAAAFAEQGTALGSVAPALAQATSVDEVQPLQLNVEHRLRNLAAFVADADQRLPTKAASLVSDLDRNLNGLSATIRQRLAIRRQADAGFGELRWLHADIVDEVEPLIAEARTLARQRLSSALPNDTGTGHPDLDRIDNLTDMGALANLAAGLLARISTASDAAEFSQTVYFLSETIDALSSRLAQLERNAEHATLKEVIERLVVLSAIEGGLPGFRRDELKLLETLRRQLEENRALLSELDRLVVAHVAAVNQQASLASKASSEALSAGRQLMTLSAFAALLVSGWVGFRYVPRNVIARITSMAAASRALADGKADVVIPAGGNDELTDMGRALTMYRRSSTDALAAERAATEQLKATQAELVQAAKLAALGQLSAGVGHELTQPIAAIRSFAHNGQVLIERSKSAEAGLALKRIEQLTMRMSAIVGHLKRFARRPDDHLHAVLLKDATADALSLFENRLGDMNIEIILDVAPGLVVQAEAVRLEQVIVNLISNALDAVEGQKVARVSLSARTVNNLVIFSVADNGSGIAEADQSRIFDPFFTTKASGSGLGLGLSTSFNIARDFRGGLRLASSSPDGTVFDLVLNAHDDWCERVA